MEAKISLSKSINKKIKTPVRSKVFPWIQSTAMIVFTLVVASNAFSSEKIVSDQFSIVQTKAKEMGDKYGRDRVLIVYDIDNTLLKPKVHLSSDQWFKWQEDLLAEKTSSPLQVAEDFEGLLDVSNLLTNLAEAELVEEGIAEIVKKLQNEGFTSIILTARNFNKVNGTLNQLRQNGLNFQNQTQIRVNWSDTYLPWDINDSEASGLTREDVARMKLTNPREALYLNGIIFANGLHKGAMLKTFLHRTNSTNLFDSIVFIDDQEKHVDRVYDTFDSMGVDTISIYYTATEAWVEDFKNSEKLRQESAEQWNVIKKVLNKTLNTTW